MHATIENDVTTPVVQSEESGPEFTCRAIFVGLLLAVIFAAANAYLGLKAGMTVAATFPAAVIAIAIFRPLRGGVLEQNIARTTATVGEALVAAAIFTIPAFLMAKVDGQPLWDHFDYWQSVLILGCGGVLGLLFIIVMRRTLTVDAGLPFPESHACFKLVQAGQGGDTGARFVFGAMGLGMLLELLKNEAGLALFKVTSRLTLPLGGGKAVALTTPLVSPAILGVGFIIGPRFASLAFAGGALAWLVIVPLCIFFQGDPSLIGADAATVTRDVWASQVRPMAVGAMFLAAFYTLWGLRGSIRAAFHGVFHRSAQTTKHHRRERDLNVKGCFAVALLLCLPLGGFFYHTTGALLPTLVITAVMFGLGFLLAVIGGWLVGLIGSSNQPVSGVTLAALITIGIILFLMQVTGVAGVSATLGVSVIICAAAALSGTLIQELKVGEMLGATPWKMELAQIIGTIVVAFITVYPMVLLHESSIATALAAGLPGVGIGGESLPAPQAALMAQVATGILGGDIAWHLVALGMGITALMIVLRIPGPMVVAVGMYLSLHTTAAIFVGGLLKGLLDRHLAQRPLTQEARTRAVNRGTLLASGLIAGEALTGVILAGVVMMLLKFGGAHLSLTGVFTHQAIFPLYEQAGGLLSIIAFGVIAATLLGIPVRKLR